MPKNKGNIPVNSMDGNFSRGISIDEISIRNSDFENEQQYAEATQSHRDEGHTFHIVLKGSVHIEIDFKMHEVTAPSVVYMHPNQVHRILDFKDITVCSLSITNENLTAGYLKLLEEITPIEPLLLNDDDFSLISEATAITLKYSKKTNDRLYHPILKDLANALVALTISQYLEQSGVKGKISRPDAIYNAFRKALESGFMTIKGPTKYATSLNISTAYLNECVKGITGNSVTHHIQQRIILEAKRLLYHSDKSVKEIAYELGYEDYPYFSRLFSNVTGMTALDFRSKNRE